MTDILIEERKEEERYFRNYLDYAREIKKEAEKNLGKVKVFLFGSIIKDKIGPGSDIDILIISSKLGEALKKSEIRAKILKKIGSPNPFELHLITPQEYKDWYSHFIKEKIEI